MSSLLLVDFFFFLVDDKLFLLFCFLNDGRGIVVDEAVGSNSAANGSSDSAAD